MSKLGPAKLWWLSCRAYQARHPRTAKFFKALNYLCFKCLLPYEAEMHPDVILEHYALGVVIHPNVTLGRGVRIYHHVTLAPESEIGSEHRIYVGNNVTIGVGATVLGRGNQSLHIGDNAFIGAGAVVTRDVPPGERVVGVPARPVAAPLAQGR